MRKFQCFLFVLKGSYARHYIIGMTAPLTISIPNYEYGAFVDVRLWRPVVLQLVMLLKSGKAFSIFQALNYL